jgi:acetyl-CoA carboxylase biotin carboxyl carrier protein
MNLDDIKHILDLVRAHDLSEFELERDGLKIRVRKANSHAVVEAPPAAPARTPPRSVAASSPAAEPALSAADEPNVDLAVIKSPIVGTFYRSPEPGARAFVEVGDRVKKGQVLCIIEAMKLMNEIESETDGEIATIYVENGKPVQFGDRLFAVRVDV